jgi:hypothetical protein
MTSDCKLRLMPGLPSPPFPHPMISGRSFGYSAIVF